MDTTAVKQVPWCHELIFTPEDQPTVYNSISCMAFVNGYLSIMALQTDILRNGHSLAGDDGGWGDHQVARGACHLG